MIVRIKKMTLCLKKKRRKKTEKTNNSRINEDLNM